LKETVESATAEITDLWM